MVKKDNQQKILKAIFQNPRSSDRDIAKKCGVSQPTVTRFRNMAIKKRFIYYQAIPNLPKFGYPIIAISEIPKSKKESETIPEKINSANKIQGDNRIFFVVNSMNGDYMMALSLHRNFGDYVEFARKFNATPYELSDTREIIKNIKFEIFPSDEL